MKKFSVFLILVFASACVTEPKRNTAEPEWYSRMHRLSATYLNLTPIIADNKKFSDPRNHEVLDSELRRLAEIAVDVSRDPKAPNADPIIEYTANIFAAETRQAYAAFKAGDPSWTRFAVRRAGDYCVACHARADRGAKDFPLAWEPQLGALDSMDKIDFWLSNRQYSKAIGETNRLAADESSVNRDSLAWLKTIEKTMTVLVRVSHDDEAAERLAQLALSNRAVPFYIRTDLKEWTRDIAEWRAQKGKRSERMRLKLAESLLEKNERLPFRRTHGAFIANLRASSLLHELLENSKSPVYSDALMFSGAASENLGDFSLGQYYYEACIRNSPHSLPAERCYSQLLASIKQTNPYLQSEKSDEYGVQMNLERLREMAGPIKTDTPRFEKHDEP